VLDQHPVASETPPPPDGPPGAPGGYRTTPLPLVLIALGIVALGLVYGLSIVLVILSIVAMIFLHELGHYLTAKRAGMKVTEFYLGFGPRLWSFRRGETEYGVKVIPAGAYVRIIGMNNLEEVDPADEARTYRQQSYPARMSVALAGSGMHFLIALTLLFVSFMTIGVDSATNWTVKATSAGSAAEQAGIRPGDRIISIDGTEVETFEQVRSTVESLGGRTVAVVIERDGARQTVQARLGERISAEAAAGLDGVLPRDEILAVDGRPVASYDEFTTLVTEGGTYQVRLVDERGQELTTQVRVDRLVTGPGASYGLLGVSPDWQRDQLGPVRAAGRSITTFRTASWATVTGLANFFRPSNVGDFVSKTITNDKAPDATAPSGGDAGREAAAGTDENRLLSILGAGRIGKQAADQGLAGLVDFMILLNITVGLFNLLPLPPFDGGHVVVATYERLRSRRGRRYFADASKLMPITIAVIAVFVTLGLLALLRDILDPINLPT